MIFYALLQNVTETGRAGCHRAHAVTTMTRVRYDVFLADCPARTTLALIADTWSVVVVHALGEQPRRHSELRERIGGISKKMLTQTLRKLERNGLVQPRRLRTAPPGVEYRLTELGGHAAVTTAPGASVSEEIARATGARVAKAFNQVHFDVWRRGARYAGQPLVVPIAGDPDAKAVANILVRDAGADPLDAGGLEHAHQLEAMAAVIIRLLFGGADPLSAFQFTTGTAAPGS